MIFKPSETIFFRVALRPFKNDTFGSEKADLREWICESPTLLALKLAYPKLYERIYGVDNGLEQALLDVDLSTTLSELETRSKYLTVPLGGFVALGVSRLERNSESNSSNGGLKFNNLNAYFFKKTPDLLWKDLDASLQGVELLSVNPLRYFKQSRLHFLASEPNPDAGAYGWRDIPFSGLLTELIEFMKVPRSLDQALRWGKKKSVPEAVLNQLLAEGLRENLFLCNHLEDRFSFRTIIESKKAIQRFELALPSQASIDLDVVITAGKSKPVHLTTNQLNDLERASKFILALDYQVAPEPTVLAELKKAFLEEHDTHAVSLLDFIDPLKMSRGFRTEEQPSKPAVLPKFFLDQAAGAIENHAELILDRNEVDEYLLNHPVPPTKLSSFSTSFFLRTDQSGGKVETWIRKIFGGPGVRPMSRFFRHLSSPMTSEQVVAKLPRGFIWAEIGAGPQCSKKDLFEVSLGNLPYIDCFNTPRSGVNKISLSDLSLVFRGGCLLLWSSQRKCFIVPLQSNAVNQMLDQHPAALLLMIVSLQFQTGDVGFRWNSLSGLPWLPRVRIGDTFIAGEQWTLSGQEVLNTLENTGGDEAINNFKKKWRLRGDLFTAHNHGSELCFDLRLPSAARSLKKHARKVLKSAIVLKIEESAFGSSPLGFQLGGEQLTTEFILPFARPITVTQSLSEKEFRGSFNTAAASEILSIVIVASAIGQDAILTEIERLFRRGKVKWFFLRVGVNAEELKLRFFANNSREKKRIRNRIEAFLSKKNIQALFRHWYSDQYQPETSVYDSSVQLNLYHKISNFDSRFAIESILCAEECDDYLPALIESAWLSSLSYARQLEPREQEKSRSSVGSKERVDFYRGKENAIQVLSGARKSPFYPILQRRERAINRLLVKRGKQLLTQPEREIFFRRAVHLSLNRLNSILLRQFEPLIFNEVIGAAEYLRRQSEM